MNYRDRTLVVMAKAPRPGSVKTRLAQSLPQLAVVELYSCLLEDTVRLAQSLDATEAVILCPASDVEDLSRATAAKLRVVAQTGDGLAAGLASVFVQFVAPGHRRVIAFNSDSPHLPASVLENAFELLASHDIVVGPTQDGGYYLVGAKASHPGLFADDGMGTVNAFDALVARARALGLSVGLTDRFYDIDVTADLGRLAVELQQSPAKAPRTAEWLKRWASILPQIGQSSDAS